jgi:L-arabinose transport system substrate-binding protein
MFKSLHSQIQLPFFSFEENEQMKRTMYYVVTMLILASVVLSACSPAATPTAAPAAPTTAPAAPTTAPVAAPTTAPAAATSAPAASGSGPLLVVINKSADQQYFIDLQNSFSDTATGLGATVKKYNAKLDPNLGVSLVNDAISAGAKGISITVPDQTIGPAISDAAKKAGIVLIATDDGIKDSAGNPVPFVGFDGKDMGKKVGEEASTLLTTAGWLKDTTKKVGVLSVEVQTLSVCNDRTDNEKAAIEAAGVPAAQVFSVPYTGETLASQDAAGPIITAHPDVTNWVVFACNDEGVLGTLNALGTAGVKPENIIGVGLGAYEACKPWAAGQASGFKAGLFISGLDVGKTAATVLYNAVVKGVTPPANSYAPTTIVDPTNYKTVMDPISLANCSK